MEESLRSIADELHNLNINMCELISILKNNKPNNSDDVDIDEIKAIHESQLESKKNIDNDAIEKEKFYQEKQKQLDAVLHNLGIM